MPIVPWLISAGRWVLAYGVGALTGYMSGDSEIVNVDGDYNEDTSSKSVYLIVSVSAILGMLAMYFICKYNKRR